MNFGGREDTTEPTTKLNVTERAVEVTDTVFVTAWL